MLQQEGKYLFFSFRIHGGFEDQINHLETMMITALSLKRILIINETETSPQHRTSKRYVPFNWNRYVDLAKTKIAEIAPNKTIEEIKHTFRWVNEKDFDFKSYTKEQIRYIDGSQLYESENEHYPILHVFHIESPAQYRNKLACRAEDLILFQGIQCYCKVSYNVTLFPSQKVNDLTDIVLNYFGTDRQSSRYIQAVLRSKTKYGQHDFITNYYICMHIRANDIMLINRKNYFSVQKDQIRYIIKTVAQKHPNSPIYIMSDVRPDYFNFLKPEHRIYTYEDFPKLKDLFSSKTQTVDHNLLYAMERNIMHHAVVRILAPGKNMLLFETDALYETPPNVNISFNSFAELRKREWQNLIHLGRLDKLIMIIRNLKKRLRINID